MKTKYTSYYLFKLSRSTDHWWQLIKKEGEYKRLKYIQNRMIKIPMTENGNLFLHFQKKKANVVPLRILNNLTNSEAIRVGSFSYLKDIIVVHYFQSRNELELFVFEDVSGSVINSLNDFKCRIYNQKPRNGDLSKINNH